MVLIPINEAEAMLETFWDGGSSEQPSDKPNMFRGYAIHVPPSVIGSVTQIWCALKVEFERGEPGSTISLERCCAIDTTGYDTFRIFASIPSWVSLTITGTVDGRKIPIIDHRRGEDTNDELDGPLPGSRLQSLTVQFTLEEDRPASMQILWFGLANGERQAEMEGRTSPYSAEWEGLLDGSDPRFEPELGIFFGGEEIDSLRTILRSGRLSGQYRKILARSREYLRWEPEKDIGKYVPNPDRRWVRNHDMKRLRTAGIMEVLAFVGLVERDVEMLTMAARMALSAAHCEYWAESIVGTMPGTTWHHRSFTEEIYCRACALVLDWAGEVLTPAGKQLLRDAIVMKGLPRIESDFKRMEYIRSMNQGIVFSSGRIIGTLALLDAHPRYSSLIDEAERDLHAMIERYVHSDGGTLEGMAYWSYTFSTAMPLFYALARHRGQTLAEYATPVLRKTGDYGLAMLSTTGNGTTYLPVNDAHAGRCYPAGLIAAYTRLSGKPGWASLYRQTESADAEPDIYHFILAQGIDAGLEDGSSTAPRFDLFPEVGQMSSVRGLRSGGVSLFHLCSGPTYGGHYHQDKGSIIVEAGGEPLAFDRGVTDYHHPEVNLIGMASRHNLLYPEPSGGGFFTQPGDADGGRLTSALSLGDIVVACSDNTRAWAADLFRRNLRRIYSPSSDLFIVDDEVEMGTEAAMSFRMNSPFPIGRVGSGAVIMGERYALRIVPMNWEPLGVEILVEGIDSHLHPVNLLKLTAGRRRGHRLLTVLEIAPVSAPDGSWILERSGEGVLTTTRGEERSTIDFSIAGFIRASHAGKDGLRVEAVCRRDMWSFDRAL